MDGDGGTFLEDFLLSLEMVPNNVRRDCELVSLRYPSYASH